MNADLVYKLMIWQKKSMIDGFREDLKFNKKIPITTRHPLKDKNKYNKLRSEIESTKIPAPVG